MELELEGDCSLCQGALASLPPVGVSYCVSSLSGIKENTLQI